MENNFEQELHKGAKELKEIKMSAREKDRMLAQIFSAPALMPIKSPYLKYRVTIFLPALLLVLMSGSMVFASGSSLPGNLLYPIKVNVVEKVQGAFIFTPEGGAEYESSLATKRLVEAEELAKNGKLNKVEEEKINYLLSEHTNALRKNLGKLHEKKSDLEMGIAADFNTNMNTHADLLDGLEARTETRTREEGQERVSKRARENGAIIRGSLEEKNELEFDD